MKIWTYMKRRAASEGLGYSLPKELYYCMGRPGYSFGVTYDEEYNVVDDMENPKFFESIRKQRPDGYK